MNAAEHKTCPQCGQSFACGLSLGRGTCWCFDRPRVMPVVEDANCLCPECLGPEIAARLKSQPARKDERESS